MCSYFLRSNIRNVNFGSSLRWPIFIVKSLDKTILFGNTLCQCSPNVSVVTYSLHFLLVFSFFGDVSYIAHFLRSANYDMLCQISLTRTLLIISISCRYRNFIKNIWQSQVGSLTVSGKPLDFKSSRFISHSINDFQRDSFVRENRNESKRGSFHETRLVWHNETHLTKRDSFDETRLVWRNETRLTKRDSFGKRRLSAHA